MQAMQDDGTLLPAAAQTPLEYTILKQNVNLDIDFVRQAIRGSTEITLQPLTRDLKHIRLHCRQCRPLSVQASGMNAKWDCNDPYRRLRMPSSSTVHQHEMLKSKIESSLGPTPQPELDIILPPKLKLQELQVDPVSALPQYANTPSLQKQESDAMALLETPTALASQGPQFAPIMLYIEFEVQDFRNGLHWIGLEDEDNRYPHVYTTADLQPGNTSCIFPCLDDATTRCSWDISIRCAKTLGAAFRKSKDDADGSERAETNAAKTNGVDGVGQSSKKRDEYYIDLTEEDAALDLTVLCVGELVDDVSDPDDETFHTVSFSLTAPVTARHVGFAVGPFEQVDIGAFREADDEDKLGQSAVKILAYCLPSRAEELRNTAMPVHMAIDFFGVNYGSFPFNNYQMLFIDDSIHNTVPLAGMTICSSRLLFAEDILEPLNRNTKILMRAVADQWMGVNVIAKEATDAWVVAGIAGFMTDLFNKRLFGNNDYRWSQKIAAEQVYDLDADRPSIHQLGSLLHLDQSIRDFVDLKSALVLFILDRRLMKASSSTGVTRIINKIFLNVKTGSFLNGELSTADFQRTCEKLGHNKLDPFFRQWVFGAGCPIFEIKQRFNKKKLVVEMTITQRQMERQTKPEFAPANFMREIKEHVQEVWAPEVQPVFTGPMTIRIHEADGTPYEHIVEIKEQITKLEIPYNTKYKRLKRSRRQRERAVAAGQNDASGEGGDDALLYCLGDILDSAQEVEDWNLKDWSQEDEDKMGQESYEWIRMDADFEWIGRIHLWLPVYMYVSQLQQDRDLAAQFDSIKYIESCGPHHVSLSVLVRTLMDRRYFHGIRTMAATAISTISKDKLQEVGQHHLMKAFSESFCFENSIMPRPNDWSSRVTFIMQCAIPTAMANLRDNDGKVPLAVRQFFVDKLKFNDNSNNEYSDAHYVAILMTCLADSLAVSHREVQPSYHFSFGADDDVPMELENPDADFEKEAVDEIERYRRIDEWISTYQNIYSVTALDCLQKLTKAGIVKDKTRELLIYTRKQNADAVRLEAYKSLNEIGIARKSSMLKYLLHELGDDTSPYFRHQLLQVFGEALGHIALGDDESQKPPPPPPAEDGLVIEQEVDPQVRQMELSRKTTPEGALAALKNTLQGDASFQDAIWYAITSPCISIAEVGALVDVAALLYDAKTSYVVKLSLPRPYRATKVKGATVRFSPHGAYRSSARVPLPLEDWQLLQKHNLKYSGPLAPEVESLSQIDEEKSLKSQIETLKQQAANLQASKQSANSDMPPPVLPTLSTEKSSGLKLSLGAKRKQSLSANSREESPKAVKTSDGQSAHASARSPAPRASPSINLFRRSTTPGSIASQHSKKSGNRNLMVVLKLGANSSNAAKILSTPAQGGRPTSSRQSSHTPALQTGSLSTASPALSTSPQPQQPQFNVGGFRSFGPPIETSSEMEEVKPESPMVKRETTELSNSTAVLDTLPTQSPTVMSPESMTNGINSALSTSEVPAESAVQTNPPKKKFTLKLTRKPSQEQA